MMNNDLVIFIIGFNSKLKLPTTSNNSQLFLSVRDRPIREFSFMLPSANRLRSRTMLCVLPSKSLVNLRLDLFDHPHERLAIR